ncbi:MAG TPA: PQQ-dependent sugar dehydrogenase [Syntrophorhabdaceae bacterium]|nr:PQQ-dependent sugar dehydrogenase [Syntrophorhabdaceae bacterium]
MIIFMTGYHLPSRPGNAIAPARIAVILVTILLTLVVAARPAVALEVGPVPQAVQDRFLPEGDNIVVRPWISGLEVPWSLVFLPDGRALVSERPGRIRLIRKGVLAPRPWATIDVRSAGEGGLMGLAVHPAFPGEPYVYAMYTYTEKGETMNRVVRFKDDGDTGRFDRVILDRIPGARNHNGGRIAFGPDGMLYICTGEKYERKLAQDLNSLNGKILRVTPGGVIPPDNPFNSPVWSYGHRNPQGLAWHPVTGELFVSEHGPSGESLVFGNDEINIIVRGGNYGWPVVAGAPSVKPYRDPIIVWKRATPPGGITFCRKGPLSHLENDLFIATLRSDALIRVKLRRERDRYAVTAIERWFVAGDVEGRYGRIRDVVQGPDGYLYFLTSNRDGRGSPRQDDDRIYRIMPRQDVSYRNR